MLESHVMGDLIAHVKTSTDGVAEVTLHDVLVVPELGSNLMSVHRLCARGITVDLDRASSVVSCRQGDQQVTIPLKVSNHLFYLKVMRQGVQADISTEEVSGQGNAVANHTGACDL